MDGLPYQEEVIEESCDKMGGTAASALARGGESAESHHSLTTGCHSWRRGSIGHSWTRVILIRPNKQN